MTEANPNLTVFVTIGESLEGRDQPAIHISPQVGTDAKRIYFQCQIHASTYEIMELGSGVDTLLFL